MNVIIDGKKIKGDVDVIGSKSVTHRAIICASLVKGKSIIRNVTYSDDIIATINACEAFGAIISKHENYLEIIGSEVKRINNVVDCNESGSTLRFMIPILMTCDGKVTFTGKNNLVNRPLDVYTKIFDEFDIKYSKEEKELPLTIFDRLKSGTYNLDGSVSSQFVSGMLMALVLLNEDSKLVLTTPLASKGYVDITIDVMSKFGIEIINNEYKEFIIKGNQSYKPINFDVEGDFSQAAFFLVASTLGSEININNMNNSSVQGDKKIIDDINDLGGDVRFDANNKLVAKYSKTIGTTIDFEHTPDIAPILALLASVSEGKTTFLNISRLRIKECDRALAIVNELSKLGTNIYQTENEMFIDGVSKLEPSLELDSHKDHRIVMMLAIASTIIDGKIRIKDVECIKKSYPNFFEVLQNLGANIEYEY